VCQKMEQRISKWRNGRPNLHLLCSAQHFRNECGPSRSDKTDFGNRRFRIRRLTTAVGMSIRKVDTFVHGELGVTI
jgi:hypothetical protein